MEETRVRIHTKGNDITMHVKIMVIIPEGWEKEISLLCVLLATALGNCRLHIKCRL